jgi:hypothetical protein
MKWQRETTFPHHAVLRAVRELHCRRAEVSKPTTTKDDIRRCAEGQIPRRDHLPLIFRAVLVALLSAGHAGAPLEVDKAIALTRAEPRGVLECQPYKETPVFGVLSLCLSRTCLGKMIVLYIQKWCKKICVFFTGETHMRDTLATQQRLQPWQHNARAAWPRSTLWQRHCDRDPTATVIHKRPVVRRSDRSRADILNQLWRALLVESTEPCRKTWLCSQLFRCLSRAWLGKLIILVYRNGCKKRCEFSAPPARYRRLKKHGCIIVICACVLLRALT